MILYMFPEVLWVVEDQIKTLWVLLTDLIEKKIEFKQTPKVEENRRGKDYLNIHVSFIFCVFEKITQP